MEYFLPYKGHDTNEHLSTHLHLVNTPQLNGTGVCE